MRWLDRLLGKKAKYDPGFFKDAEGNLHQFPHYAPAFDDDIDVREILRWMAVNDVLRMNPGWVYFRRELRPDEVQLTNGEAAMGSRWEAV